MALVSMTGFGTSTFDAGDGRYECIVRSVNRRTLDVTIRLPPEFTAMEPTIRRPIQVACGRGDVLLVLERVGSTGRREVHVDEEAALALHDAYRKVAAAVGSSEDVPLSALLSASEVVSLHRGRSPSTDVTQDVIAGIGKALEDLGGTRAREGQALERDVMSRLGAIRDSWDRVRGELPLVNQALMDRAADRARALAEAAGVDVEPSVLATALASLAEKADVSEEVSRMEAHVTEFESLVEGAGPHGRRLDFLSQEMMREVGTTAAKCQNARVSHLVVEIKAELERIREQLANVL
ncbi:MAG: YicC family protein [Deltaproteobacteria bacterium]|nr:YicC family protein [Deltaproteobacteria bacterium]